MRSRHVEIDEETFPSGCHYSVSYYPGIAFWVEGWETEPDEDTEWSGIENRTGMVLAVMVGDDYRHKVDPEDLSVKVAPCTSGGIRSHALPSLHAHMVAQQSRLAERS